MEDSVQLTIHNLPVMGSELDVGVISSKLMVLFQGEDATCSDDACAYGIGQLEVLSSSQDGVEISVSTPSWRLPFGVTQQLVKARVEHSSRPDLRLEFQYVYEAVVPSITSATPIFGFDSESTEVSVTIRYFPYLSGVRVSFGDFVLADMDVTVWPSTNRERTQISFKTPRTVYGQYTVKISPKSCPMLEYCIDDAGWVETNSETVDNDQGGQTTTTWTTKCEWVASNLDSLGQLCHTPIDGYAAVDTVRAKCPAACGACPSTCPKFVTFTFDKRNSLAPRVISDTSLMQAKQKEAISGIRIQHFPAAAQYTGITAYFMDEHDTVLYDVNVQQQDVSYVSSIYTITQILVPDALKEAPEAMYTLKLATESNFVESSVRLSYFAFDGLAPRVISVLPMNIPNIIQTYGKTLHLRSKVTVVVSNFPQDAPPTDVFALVGVMSVRAELVSIENLVTCGATEIDCSRTKLVLRFPAMEVEGTQQVTLYPTKPGFSPARFQVNYVQTCDYEAYCNSLALLPDYKMLLDHPVSTCEVQYLHESSDDARADDTLHRGPAKAPQQVVPWFGRESSTCQRSRPRIS